MNKTSSTSASEIPGPSTSSILLSMFAGMFLGLVLQAGQGWIPSWCIDTLMTIIKVGSALFLSGLKLLVVPLIFVSLVCGVANLGETTKLGKIGGLTILLYLLTTAIAVTIALSAAVLIQPGAGLSLPAPESFTAPVPPSLLETIINFFPTNPVKAMADGNTMQIIVFALLCGYALIRLGESGSRLTQLFNDANALIMKMVEVIILLAPYGVFCLIAEVFFQQGLATILPLLKYFACVVLVLFIHLGVVYQAILYAFTGVSPLTFFTRARQAIIFGFSTSSSNATIPVTLETAIDSFKIPRWISSFTIPLGATINMDGTAIMQGVATVFVAQLYSIEMSLAQYLTVIGMATLASIGTAGVPGVGIIMLTMVFQQVGLPLDGIALILSVDRLLDMLRTSVNIAGDLVVTNVVYKITRSART